MRFARPESVLVVVHTRAGEVLLLRRREPPDWWQSVTGTLEPGENPLRAARRELREELGLVADLGLEETGVVNTYPLIEPWRDRYAPGTLYNTEHVLRIEVDAPFAPTLREHLEHAWLTRADALARATSATDRAAIAALAPASDPAPDAAA